MRICFVRKTETAEDGIKLYVESSKLLNLIASNDTESAVFDLNGVEEVSFAENDVTLAPSSNSKSMFLSALNTPYIHVMRLRLHSIGGFVCAPPLNSPTVVDIADTEFVNLTAPAFQLVETSQRFFKTPLLKRKEYKRIGVSLHNLSVVNSTLAATWKNLGAFVFSRLDLNTTMQNVSIDGIHWRAIKVAQAKSIAFEDVVVENSFDGAFSFFDVEENVSLDNVTILDNEALRGYFIYFQKI